MSNSYNFGASIAGKWLWKCQRMDAVGKMTPALLSLPSVPLFACVN